MADYSASDGNARLTIDGDPRRLSGATGKTLVRVTQEALTNVGKHAPGAEVTVTVHAGEHAGDDVVLTVSDTAATRPQARPELAGSGGGYGLRGMRERAELVGGTLSGAKGS